MDENTFLKFTQCLFILYDFISFYVSSAAEKENCFSELIFCLCLRVFEKSFRVLTLGELDRNWLGRRAMKSEKTQKREGEDSSTEREKYAKIGKIIISTEIKIQHALLMEVSWYWRRRARATADRKPLRARTWLVYLSLENMLSDNGEPNEPNGKNETININICCNVQWAELFAAVVESNKAALAFKCRSRPESCKNKMLSTVLIASELFTPFNPV
jgi:hypothetical protein